MKKQTTISFVIPVYNETHRLEKTFTALNELHMPKELILEEVIFVNDGSIDTTAKMIKAFIKQNATKFRSTLITYTANKGKGYAIRSGMLASTADYTLFFDADISTPLGELKKFVPEIIDGTDVIIGTRKNGHSTVIIHQPRYRELLGKCFTLLSQLILNTWVTDFTCGFKAFSRTAIDTIFAKATINRWGYDSEILFLARKAGFSMTEVPVKWSDDQGTKVRLFKAIFTSLGELLTIRKNSLMGVYSQKTELAPSLA
jgi:glycosyltransferase involved in cell wall biosynthesis